MAIYADTGIIYFELQQSSMASERFQHFIDNVEVVLDGEETYLLLDNATIHRNVETTDDGHVVKRISPYSPFLNPIEEAFSTLKAAGKARLNKRNVRQQLLDQRGHINQQQTLFQYRMHILEQLGTPGTAGG